MTKRRETVERLSINLPDVIRQFEGNFRSIGEYKPLPPEGRLRRRDRRKTHSPSGGRFIRIAVSSGFPREDLAARWLKAAKRRFIDAKTRRTARPPQILFWKDRPRVVYCEKTFTWTCEARLAVV